MEQSLPLFDFAGAKPSSPPQQEVGVTFKDSLKQGPFGWYPYVEGFSANYVKNIIAEIAPRNVFDPFGGSGTTCLAAAMTKTPSAFSELNPFMRFVAEAKTNGLREAAKNHKIFSEIVSEYISEISSSGFAKRAAKTDLDSYHRAFPDRDFFVEKDLRELLACLDLCSRYTDHFPYSGDLLKLAVAANIVKSSNMTRRADLRRRRPDEYKTRSVNVFEDVASILKRMQSDVLPQHMGNECTTFVSNDARNLPAGYEEKFDCVITSPPYLNGTNYFRNTKLELWMLGFIASEKGLSEFYKKSVAGGINSVQSGREQEVTFPSVERVVVNLEQCEGDKRIPKLVRHYFSDMYSVLQATKRSLTKSGRLYLDIGDSKFYGVHVPTDQLLIDVAQAVGLNLINSTVLAKRYSRDKSLLRQVELVFERGDV